VSEGNSVFHSADDGLCCELLFLSRGPSVLTYLVPDALQVVAPSSVRNPVDEDKSPDRVFVQWYGILGG